VIRHARGFNLTELMMVVAISGILLSLALPGFRTLTLNTRRTVAINALVSGFSLARSEALKRGAAVTVCGLDSSGAGCANGADWSYGWMVFVDTNANGAWDAGEPAPLQKFATDEPAQRRVTANTYGATAGFVLLQPFNQGATSATITVCDSRGAGSARAVTVSNTGRAAASDKDVNYAALTCP
jgi:type IV fimbrial biogenesis protein FimT